MKYPHPAFRGTEFILEGDLLKEVQTSGHNYYVYILECNDHSYYTGLTNDLESRLWEHNKGLNCGCYTFMRRPVILRYFELYHGILEAIDRENQIKGWSRKKKEALFNLNWEKLEELSKSSTNKQSPRDDGFVS